MPPPDATSPKLSRTVVMLGLVSLAMDISSEMIHALLPLFLVTVLGASAANDYRALRQALDLAQGIRGLT